MTTNHYVPDTYRSRDEMTLQEFIEDVESVHFRTPYDTGANYNAMFIWNIVRQKASLDRLTMDDLIMKYYGEEQGMTLEEGRVAHKEYNEFRKSLKK